MRHVGEGEPSLRAWEDADELCRFAAAEGFEVDRDALRRFHRAGVISRPTQRHLGARGSQTLYPPGTSAILLEACELHRTERRLGRVAWALWWRGVTPVHLAARTELTQFAQRLVEHARTLVGEEGDLSSGAREMLGQAASTRLPGPMVRIRRRVTAQRFGDVMESLILVGTGRAATLSAEAVEQIEHALGLDRARSDILGSTGRPWLDGDARDDLVAIGELSSPEGFADALASASDDEIDASRDEAKMFATGISDVAHAMRSFSAEWAYGIGGWGPFFEQMLLTHDGQVYLVLLWLRIRQAGLGPGAAAVFAELEKQPKLREQVDQLAGLFDVIPELREALPSDWYERALRDSDFRTTIEGTLADLRRDYGEAIDAHMRATGANPSRDVDET